MLDDFLLKLRKKPARVKHAILIGTTTGLTGIIFLIWLSYWASPAPISNIMGDISSSSGPSAQTGAAPSLLLKDNWQSLVGTFRDGFSEIGKQFK